MIYFVLIGVLVFFFGIVDLLRDILVQGRKSLELEKVQVRLLERILDSLTLEFPTSFDVQEVTMQSPIPGATLQFTATPVPAGSTLGGVVPTWTTSDPVNTALNIDPTGLIATVILSASIAVGSTVTVTVSATDPATGSTATGSASFTVVAASTFPTSFDVVQTA